MKRRDASLRPSVQSVIPSFKWSLTHRAYNSRLTAYFIYQDSIPLFSVSFTSTYAQHSFHSNIFWMSLVLLTYSAIIYYFSSTESRLFLFPLCTLLRNGEFLYSSFCNKYFTFALILIIKLVSLLIRALNYEY